MQVQRIDNMFNFTYQKPAEQIKEMAKLKIAKLQAKVAEREARLREAREANGITDAVLNSVMLQIREQEKSGGRGTFSNSVSVNRATEETVTVGAGLVNMLLTEMGFVEEETRQIKKLELIARNLENRRIFHGRVENVRGAVSPIRPEDPANWHQDPIDLTQQELEYLGF
jgi:hypothetical protein